MWQGFDGDRKRMYTVIIFMVGQLLGLPRKLSKNFCPWPTAGHKWLVLRSSQKFINLFDLLTYLNFPIKTYQEHDIEAKSARCPILQKPDGWPLSVRDKSDIRLESTPKSRPRSLRIDGLSKRRPFECAWALSTIKIRKTDLHQKINARSRPTNIK